MIKVSVVNLEKRRNFGDLAEVEVKDLEGADSLERDLLDLISS